MLANLRTTDDIFALRETENLECKLAQGRDGNGAVPKDMWETYSAFANSDGGVIILGLKETKDGYKLAGIKNTESVVSDIYNTANNASKVSSNLLANNSVEVIEIDEAKIILIQVPRAPRQSRPVFLNGNPLGNSYRRQHEGDQRLSNEQVKRLLAEQVEDSRDSTVLPHFGMEDIDFETLQVYRQSYANLNPGAPWNELDNVSFLRKVGAFRVDRETGIQGLTAAGLLMFGSHPAIQEVFPNYMLDYQERPEAKTERRWVDRVTLDGSWSGNLYDFYRKVYRKLTSELKVPFELKQGLRQEDTPVHQALREALANVLVHSDYTDRASILVVKRPDMFGFRNPGLMRIPIDIAMQGGEPDCRNRTLHQMFRYVNVGEQAGSGIPKILAGWRSQHWRAPLLRESTVPYDQTLLELRMLDLFPAGIVDALCGAYGDEYTGRSQTEQIAMAVALSESGINHSRLAELTNEHSADVTKALQKLTSDKIFETVGAGRGVFYHLSGLAMPSPDDVFRDPVDQEAILSHQGPLTNSMNTIESSNSPSANDPSSSVKVSSSPVNASSSPVNASSSPVNASSSPVNDSSPSVNGVNAASSRDEDGRLISELLVLPIVDSLEELSSSLLQSIEASAILPRTSKRISRPDMESVLSNILKGHYMKLECIASLVDRKPDFLRESYLSPMVKQGRLELAFPQHPNHPKQAYTFVKLGAA